MLTAVLLHYYESRFEYLQRAISALCSGSLIPSEIIVWNNGRTPLDCSELSGAIVVNSSFNWGCMVRHCIAQMALNHFIFLQDDDLLVGNNALRTLYEFCKYMPLPLLGPMGSQLGPPNAPYLGRKNITNAHAAVDIVLGRMQMCRKAVLANAFSFLAANPSLRIPFREDDILVSLVNRRNRGNNFVVPVEYQDLDERGEGLSWDKQHYNDRDLFCKQILDMPRKPICMAEC